MIALGKKNSVWKWAPLVAALLVAGCNAAETPEKLQDKPLDKAAVATRLQALIPGAQIDKVSRIGQSGIYEVVMGTQVLYVDASLRYLLDGNLIDIEKRVNLTAARSTQLNRVDFSSLPTADAIVTVKGDGRRKLAVFSDPDCPYCKRLEGELAKLDNVTIYTYLYPIVSLHPKAAERSVSVWCAPDRAKAWTAAMTGGTVTPARCDSPVPRTVELGKRLNINATPTLIFADGQRGLGAMPASQIEAQLN